MGGNGDENSTADVSALIRALDDLRVRHGCAVLLVHHTPHSDPNRARGSTVLRGSMDAEFSVTREDEEGPVRLHATKMKDAEHPPPLAFNLRGVDLPLTDDEGHPETSAVLDPTEWMPKPAAQGKTGRGRNQEKALAILGDLHREHRERLEGADHDPQQARVSIEAWRDACLGDGMASRTFRDVKARLSDQRSIDLDPPYVAPR